MQCIMPEQRESENIGRGQEEMSRGGSMDMNTERASNMEGEASGNGRGSRGSSNRGFAAMSPERQKQIASEGGRAAHRQGVAHEWNREHMSEIGRRGGQSSGGRRNRNQQNGGEGRD